LVWARERRCEAQGIAQASRSLVQILVNFCTDQRTRVKAQQISRGFTTFNWVSPGCDPELSFFFSVTLNVYSSCLLVLRLVTATPQWFPGCIRARMT